MSARTFARIVRRVASAFQEKDFDVEELSCRRCGSWLTLGVSIYQFDPGIRHPFDGTMKMPRVEWQRHFAQRSSSRCSMETVSPC